MIGKNSQSTKDLIILNFFVNTESYLKEYYDVDVIFMVYKDLLISTETNDTINRAHNFSRTIIF